MPVAPEQSTPVWARIHVVRGGAPQRVLLRQGEPTRMVVGSAPDAQFRIDDDTVAPRQLDVLWDGEHLWLEDKLRLGCTFVNGQLLNEWVLVLGDVLVSFGSVRVWMAAGATSSPPPAGPNFAALECHQDELGDKRRIPTVRLTMTPELQALLNEAAGQ